MAYRFKHGDRPLDDYTIQRAVGGGGFGEVYYAVSDGGREVALKFLRDNPQVELRGVSHCINLKSPYLVSIFDVRKNNEGDYFIIMEYCSGPSLRDLLIAEPNGFEPQKAAFFVREIAKGLSYLHERGIVHRDLKPGNIFYDDGYVKIGDYGLSKFISISRHSAQTASVGTVHYMAPEIGSGNYSRGVDIYALGVMLYEMLLGKVPFEGSSMAEVLMKHLTTQPEVDQLPLPFGRIIRKALEKDPKDRYQSVDEMIDELLGVAEVKESLAGFSPRSLEGAVRHGGADPAASPMPSPNPAPGYTRDFAKPGGRPPHGPLPYAQPIRRDVAFPDRVSKRMDRISRKLDQKMGKLAGKQGRRRVPPPPPVEAGQVRGGQAAPSVAPTNRKRRMVLSGLLSLGMAVGLGVLIGNAFGKEEFGIAAGLLVCMMSGGIMLSRAAIGWFGVRFGPKWSRWLIRLCCSAPLLAMGAAPLFDCCGDTGGAVWLGLLLVATFANWDKRFEKGCSGEVCFGTALWTAFCGLFTTVVAAGIFLGEPDLFVFIGAAVAGAVSLIIQATAWSFPARPAVAALNAAQSGSAPGGKYDYGDVDVAPVPGGVRERPTPPFGQPRVMAVALSGQECCPETMAKSVRDPRERWLMTRAIWSVIAFILMGGAIVTFLIPLISRDLWHGDIAGSIVGCTACVSFMIFALRKTTQLRRGGFWRDSLRPFLISATMFGIGGTITGIACEWCHIDDAGRVSLVSGLVICSLAFLGLLFFTGRKPRPPKPFVLREEGGESPGESKDEPGASARGESDYMEEAVGAPRQQDNPGGWSNRGLKPHRGVAVLVLGILGINLFPLGIAAWVMGHHDLQEMDAGLMDPSGRGLTSAGQTCGIISVIIASLGTIVGLAIAATAAAGAMH